MPIPFISLTVLGNGLGQLPPSSANVCAKLGICSAGVPNTLYPEADIATAQAQLGVGPLVEATVDSLSVAGGTVIAVPLNPSTAGSFGSVDSTGATAGSLTVSAAPAQTIDLQIVTGGTPGTMTFKWRLNGGAYSAPVATTGTTFSFLVPGTLTTVTFSNNSYTSTATWTISKLGVISLSGTGTVGWVTQVSSPLDAYSIWATIVTGGALGTGVFTYSVDGGNNTSGQVLLPSGGAYAIPNTGVVLTFSAATYVVNDVFKVQANAASFGTTDVTNALTALLADPTEFGFFHIIGQPANAAAAASMAAVVDTQAQNAFAAFRFVFGVHECPTSESDSTVATAFANFVSDRTMVCAGDIGHISSITAGRVIRRNCSTVVATRLAAVKAKIHPGKVADGAVKNVKNIFRDEFKTPYLDAQRFTTMRTWPKRRGFYITRGMMMADQGSDFANVQNRRVMDIALGFLYQGLLQIVNSEVPVDPKTGFLYGPYAEAIEKSLRNTIIVGLDGNAIDVRVAVSRTEPILTTKRFPASVGIIPYGYAEFIYGTIGFVNPALQQAA